MLKPTQQHQASLAELSVLAQGQAGQTFYFGTFRGRVYLGWNYNTFKSHRDRAGTEGVIEITLETG